MNNQKMTHIPADKISFVISQLDKDVRNGNPALDNMRCIYIEEDSNIIHLLSVFDFIDLNPRPKIKSLMISQVLEN